MNDREAIKKAAEICGWSDSSYTDLTYTRFDNAEYVSECHTALIDFTYKDFDQASIDALALQLWRKWNAYMPRPERTWEPDSRYEFMSGELESDSLHAIKLMVRDIEREEGFERIRKARQRIRNVLGE